MITKKYVCSFDHGYYKNIKLKSNIRPALLTIYRGKIKKYSYPFFRSPLEFIENKKLIHGEVPKKNNYKFKKLPRFGFTGAAKSRNLIFAGSWNSIFVIDKKTLKFKNIISNRLTADIHGISYYKKKLYTTISFIDTLVITNLDGSIDSTFTIDENLNVIKNEKKILKHDWRFITKQRRGPTGNYHFNFVRVDKTKVYLTSRNIGALIELDIIKKKAKLISFGHISCSLIHDGVSANNKLYFTSVDGKILIAQKNKKKTAQEKIMKINFSIKNFKNSYFLNYFKIDKSNLKRVPTWCRGIATIGKDKILTTVDGVYGSQGFSIVGFDLNKNKKFFEFKFQKKNHFEYSKYIKYVSGFSIISI